MRTKYKVPQLSSIMEESRNAQDCLLVTDNTPSNNPILTTGSLNCVQRPLDQVNRNATNYDATLKALLIRNKLWLNSWRHSRHFLTNLGSSSVLCYSCLSSYASVSGNLNTCPFCESPLPMVLSNATNRCNPNGGLKDRQSTIIGSKKSFSWRDALSAPCTVGRKFYGVWTTVLVVWVITLVLIGDLQSYSSNERTGVTHPKTPLATIDVVSRMRKPMPAPRSGADDKKITAHNSTTTFIEFKNLSKNSVLWKWSSGQSYLWNSLTAVGVNEKVISVF